MTELILPKLVIDSGQEMDGAVHYNNAILIMNSSHKNYVKVWQRLSLHFRLPNFLGEGTISKFSIHIGLYDKA